MATAARSAGQCLRRCSAAASAASANPTRPAARLRTFASTAIRAAAADSGGAGGGGGKKKPLTRAQKKREAVLQASKQAETEGERIMNITEVMRGLVPAEQQDKMPPPASAAELEREARMITEMRREFAAGRRNVLARRDAFWAEDETDPDLVTAETGEDEFAGDDITSMAHSKLDEHRQRRHYARIIAWDMPLLAKFAQPFEPPTKDMPLRFRYTSYLGEFHPAEKKVVVQFCPGDLGLTEVQRTKLMKLLGPRYNPETEIARMSCEMFEHQAQNKRYLGDLVEKLVAEAKDPTDTFEDIPLDTRHHTFKSKPKFPKEWRMTEERRKQLQAYRAETFLLDQKRLAEGSLVDGVQHIQAALAPPAQEAESRVPEMVQVR